MSRLQGGPAFGRAMFLFPLRKGRLLVCHAGANKQERGPHCEENFSGEIPGGLSRLTTEGQVSRFR